MKNLLLYSATVLLGLATATELNAQGRKFSLPAHAQLIEDGAYYLGRAKDKDGREVEGIAFIHPRAGAARGGGRPPAGDSSCFAFMSSGARWKTVEPFVVDPANASGFNTTTVLSLIESGLDKWEAAAGKQIFGPQDAVGTVDGEDTAAPDNRNEFLFAEITDPNVIAVTIVWGRFGGPPKSRELIEWDMVCDDVEYTWGDAGPTNESLLGDTAIMDFEAIFQHESGHAAGLTHPSNTCTEETMYAYASTGETKKRTLHAGDIAGIRALYP